MSLWVFPFLASGAFDSLTFFGAGRGSIHSGVDVPEARCIEQMSVSLRIRAPNYRVQKKEGCYAPKRGLPGDL